MDINISGFSPLTLQEIQKHETHLKNKMSNRHLFFVRFIFVEIIFKDSAKFCTWLVEKVFKKEMNKSMIFTAFQKSEYTLTPAIVNGKPAEKCPQMSFAARGNYKDITLTRNSNKPLCHSVQSPP